MACLVGNMAETDVTSGKHSEHCRGPLVDDRAPYSATINVDLKLLCEHLRNSPSILYEPISDTLVGHTHWKYGIGNHARAARRILCSVAIS